MKLYRGRGPDQIHAVPDSGVAVTRFTMNTSRRLSAIVILGILLTSTLVPVDPSSAKTRRASTSTSRSAHALEAKHVQGPRWRASASDELLTFDEYPIGTTISDQYQNQGVIFDPDSHGEWPFISGDTDNPTSPSVSGVPARIFATLAAGWWSSA